MCKCNKIKVVVSAPMCGACINSELYSTTRMKCKKQERLVHKDDYCLADYEPELGQEYEICT